MTRRQVLTALSGLGIGTAILHRALAQQVQDSGKEISTEMISQAEWIAGLELSDDERKAIIGASRIRKRTTPPPRRPLDNSVAPAIGFLPRERTGAERVEVTAAPIESAPPQIEQVERRPSFAHHRTRRPPQIALRHLPRIDQALSRSTQEIRSCLEMRRLAHRRTRPQQAEAADKEIASGRYRGPLHGIPWGAKDILAVPGYKTTWGAGPYKDQTIDRKATVVQRLESAAQSSSRNSPSAP